VTAHWSNGCRLNRIAAFLPEYGASPVAEDQQSKIKIAFDKMILEISEYVFKKGNKPYKDSAGVDKDIKVINKYLKRMSEGAWSDDHAEFRVDGLGYSEGSLPNLSSHITTVLKFTCERMNPPLEILAVGTTPHEDFHHVFWKKDREAWQKHYRNEKKKSEGKKKGFRRVIVVGNLRTGEWNTEIMRGIRSMARELEIELIDEMRRDWLKKDGLNFDPNPISTIVDQIVINPEEASILIRNGDHNDLVSNIRLLDGKGFHVISTGFAHGIIKQNLHKIGELLADRCLKDQEKFLKNSGEGYLLIVHRYPDAENTTAIQKMQDSFLTTLADRKAKFTRADFPVTPYYGLNYNLMRHEYRGFLDKTLAIHGENRIAAIFAPDESYGLAALHTFEGEDTNLCRVYCERHVRSMLEIPLIEGGRQIHAACGMEPYYFGRYALRAAADRKEIYDEAQPVLLTRQDIEDYNLTSPDRIPPFFRNFDVHFNERRYAWHDWMEDYCVTNFGPTLFEARKAWKPME
jgi:hypothetical protein